MIDKVLKKITSQFNTKASVLVEQFKINNDVLTNQKTLVALEKDKRHSTFSLAKLMTVLLVCEKVEQSNLDIDKTFATIPASLLPGSSKYYQFYEKNEEVSLKILIKSSLIASSNEGALALALWHSDNELEFVKAMNKKAIELGLSNTLFTSSTGLNIEAYTTVEDMSLLAKVFITTCEPIASYSKELCFEHKGKMVYNTNKLMEKYPQIIGLKTGNFAGVGSNLINYWVDNEVHYLGIVLGAESSTLRFDIAESFIKTL